MSHPLPVWHTGLELFIQMFVKVWFPVPSWIPVPFVFSMVSVVKLILVSLALKNSPVPVCEWMVILLKRRLDVLKKLIPVPLVVVILMFVNLLFLVLLSKMLALYRMGPRMVKLLSVLLRLDAKTMALVFMLAFAEQQSKVLLSELVRKREVSWFIVVMSIVVLKKRLLLLPESETA